MFAVSSNQWFRWLIEVAKKRKQSVVLMMGSENCLEYKKKKPKSRAKIINAYYAVLVSPMM